MVSSGVVKISFETGARQTDKLGGRFLVTLGASGKAPTMHPGLTPLSLYFTDRGKVFIGGAPSGTPSVDYEADRLLHCEMTIDLDRMLWSLAIDNSEILKDASLTDFLNTGEGPFFIDRIYYNSEGGWGAQPDATFFLKNVKAVLLK